MPYYAETGRSHPPNRLTLQITLMHLYLFNILIQSLIGWYDDIVT
jgi:hypothetical protein